MTCAVCAAPCDPVVIVIPNVGWYMAPLYHFIDRTTMEGEPFCGAACALAWRQREGPARPV